MAELIGELGAADVTVAGFSLWIHQRQFPEYHDYWSGNWMYATARCEAFGSLVEVTDAFIYLWELALWLEQITALYKEKDDKANPVELDCLEPNLYIKMHRTDSLGHLEMSVHLTPDHLLQQHECIFEIDQSYLPLLQRELESVLERFPVRGSK